MFQVNDFTGIFFECLYRPFPLQDRPLASLCLTLSPLPVYGLCCDYFFLGPQVLNVSRYGHSEY